MLSPKNKNKNRPLHSYFKSLSTSSFEYSLNPFLVIDMSFMLSPVAESRFIAIWRALAACLTPSWDVNPAV